MYLESTSAEMSSVKLDPLLLILKLKNDLLFKQ